jgi:hypothetical protein
MKTKAFTTTIIKLAYLPAFNFKELFLNLALKELRLCLDLAGLRKM